VVLAVSVDDALQLADHRASLRLILRSGRSARLEGWGGPMVRDALLRSAPHHEAVRDCRLWKAKVCRSSRRHFQFRRHGDAGAMMRVADRDGESVGGVVGLR